MARRWAILVCALWLPTVALGRTWSDDTGTYHAEAELAGVENDRVVLRRPGGAGEIRIPLERLSKADREFLDQSGALQPENSDPTLPSGVDAEAVQKAEDAVKDQIKDDLAAAKTPAKREKLVARLRQLAIDNRADKASQFVLLRKAAKMAAALGQAQVLISTMADLEAMVKDPAPTWNDVLAALDTHHSVQDSALLVDKLNALIALAVAKDGYDTAVKDCNVLLAIGRQDKDLGLQTAARSMIAEANAAKEEFKRIAPATEKLKQDPSDGEANRTAGRFLVLYKRDFEHGLPLLAASSDAALKPVALADLKQKKSTNEMLSLGDLWLSVAKSVTPHTAAQERGAYWYRQARSLTDFAERGRIDSKLEPLIQRDWIDLSARVEFPRDQIGKGYWTKEGHALSSGAPGGTWASMTFPVALSRPDFELAIEIEYLSDPRFLAIEFPVGARMCSMVFDFAGDGLEFIDGKYAHENATTMKPTILKKGRRVPLRITVDVLEDQAQILVFVDRARYISWQGKVASVDLRTHSGPAPEPGHIAISQQDASNIIIHSAKLLNK